VENFLQLIAMHLNSRVAQFQVVVLGEGGMYCYFHFTGGKTESQRSYRTCTGSDDPDSLIQEHIQLYLTACLVFRNDQMSLNSV
jgi:hypothetical protein